MMLLTGIAVIGEVVLYQSRVNKNSSLVSCSTWILKNVISLKLRECSRIPMLFVGKLKANNVCANLKKYQM